MRAGWWYIYGCTHHSLTPRKNGKITGYLGTKPSTLSACLVLRMSGLLRVFPMGWEPAAVVAVDVVARAVVAQVNYAAK